MVYKTTYVRKKKFFEIIQLAKLYYPGNRVISESFSPDSFLKLNSLQAYLKKETPAYGVFEDKGRNIQRNKKREKGANCLLMNFNN